MSSYCQMHKLDVRLNQFYLHKSWIMHMRKILLEQAKSPFRNLLLTLASKNGYNFTNMYLNLAIIYSIHMIGGGLFLC